MELDLNAKKILLRKIPHGLFICGVKAHDGTVNGFTASWVTQGSFDPPLVVVAVRADGSSNTTIQETKLFSLSFLREDQKDLAAVFFKPQKAIGERFESCSFKSGPNGLPLLNDCIGGIECKVRGDNQIGDHTVYIGEVVHSDLIKDSKALNLDSTGWSYGG